MSRRFAALALVAVVLSACSGQPSPSPNPVRPSSPAVLTVVQPVAGETLHGTTVHVELSLQGAEIVALTTTDIRPDQGHVHLYVNNVLVSMTSGLEQDVPVHTGSYVVKAEFVAADHAPFNPRVWSSETIFTVE